MGMLVAARPAAQDCYRYFEVTGDAKRLLSSRRFAKDSLRPGRSAFVLHTNQMNRVVELIGAVVTVDYLQGLLINREQDPPDVHYRRKKRKIERLRNLGVGRRCGDRLVRVDDLDLQVFFKDANQGCLLKTVLTEMASDFQREKVDRKGIRLVVDVSRPLDANDFLILFSQSQCRTHIIRHRNAGDVYLFHGNAIELIVEILQVTREVSRWLSDIRMVRYECAAALNFEEDVFLSQDA